IPLESSLSLDVFPNPSSGWTNFALNLNEDAKLDIRIYDLLGKEVMTKIIDEVLPAGSHNIEVDASALSQGVYTYMMMVTGPKTTILTGRMVITR
ncbi:MAG: T9SS type A sorting domain-containing protein, partial [Bacteroidota bacterium]